MADAELPVIEYKNVFNVRLYQPCDMPDDMLRTCIECAKTHLLKLSDFQAQADEAVAKMKEELDALYGPHWHVVVGKHFGSKVTHDARNFTFFYLGDKAVLIFKCG